MIKKIDNPYRENNCFFCGKNNWQGLKLDFYWNDELKEAFTEYLPERRFIGLGDILHGGIQMGLLDELMGWTSFAVSGQMAVTADFTVKFLSPVYIQEKNIRLTCRVVSQEGFRMAMEATLTNFQNCVCTTASGSFRLLPEHKFKSLIRAK